jgi:hypothetical protein
MHRLVAAVVAIMVSFGLAASASAAVYPVGPNGSTFDNGLDGWAAEQAECTLGDRPIPLICSVTNQHTPAAGKPAGSLETSFTTLVNAVELFVGKSRWRSPAFKVEAAPSGDVVFTIDRQAEVQALLDLGGHADYRTELVDETTGSTTVLTWARLMPGPAFTTDRAVLPGAALQAGHTYHITIETKMTSDVIQAIQGIITARYDNVKLEG